MDFKQPVEAVIPGAQGKILAVLVETTMELNLRTVARLSGVSVAQASRILPSLVALGLVTRREVPPSALFRFVPDHVAVPAISLLARARESVIDEMGRTAAALDPAPVSVIVFGSFARGAAHADSDIDVVVVRPEAVEEDDDGWRWAIEEWHSKAELLTGNPVEMLEVAEHEIGERLRGRAVVWRDVARDGVTVFGAAIEQLRGTPARPS